jgi:hypothetical protein
MKSFKMKALALATLGLGGLVMAGGAFAATCPSITAGNINDTGGAGGGAWSGQTQTTGVLTIDSPGLASTSCKLNSSLSAGANAFSQATVDDTSPNNEVTYRARFYVNVDAITGLGSFDGAQIFSANSANSAPGTNPTKQILKLAIVGNGAGKNLTIIAACNNGGSNKCSVSTPLAAGANVVEVQVLIGSGTSGAVNFWVNNSNSASPTGSIASIDNSPWVGVKKAILGLASPTRNYGNAGNVGQFDEFDSRRQTFIGP